MTRTFNPLIAFKNGKPHPMNVAGRVAYLKWESGFDGFFNGDPEKSYASSRQALEGWRAAQVVSRYQEKLEHEREV